MSPRRPSSPSEESSGVIPVCTPDEMAAVDAASPEPLDVLVDRAGAAVARAALDELGGGYGRRVAVLVGKGSNGADGRVAAERTFGWPNRAPPQQQPQSHPARRST